MSTVTEETSEVTEPKTNKWVYLFDDGPGDDKSLLGGKGAGLCEMTQAGLPVPPGLVVTTEACNAFFENDKNFPEGMWEQVVEGLRRVPTYGGRQRRTERSWTPKTAAQRRWDTPEEKRRKSGRSISGLRSPTVMAVVWSENVRRHARQAYRCTVRVRPVFRTNRPFFLVRRPWQCGQGRMVLLLVWRRDLARYA